jgi:hypothetical protein
MPKMTAKHKAALATGRREASAVRRYLEALEQDGDRADTDKLRKRVEDLRGKIEGESDPLRRVEIIEQRLREEKALEDAQAAPDIEALEADFAEAVASYSERKGITYKAGANWGCPPQYSDRAVCHVAASRAEAARSASG